LKDLIVICFTDKQQLFIKWTKDINCIFKIIVLYSHFQYIHDN